MPLIEELAEPVEDRLALVDLDAAQHVRSMADEHVGAVVDRLVRQLDQEVGRQILEEPLLRDNRALVRVNRGDQEVRQVLAVADAPQDPASGRAWFISKVLVPGVFPPCTRRRRAARDRPARWSRSRVALVVPGGGV